MRIVTSSSPRPPAARKLVVASLIAALGLGLSACSAARQTAEGPAWAGAQPPVPAPQRQAAYEPDPNDPIKDAPIEPRRAQPAPDDPSEPFSPNYGGARVRPPVKVSQGDGEPETRPSLPGGATSPASASSASRAYFRKAAPVTTTTAAAD